MFSAIAPAKVNLFLGVGPIRADGYHSVTTVLHALELSDSIELAPASGLTLTCDPDVGVPTERNLAYAAACAMGSAFGREPAVALSLVKRIPPGAGLGGGSSDGAAVVAALAMLWGVDPLSAECLRVAASLGADVPFFLGRSGAALMGGRGDEFVRELPGLAATPVVLVRPIEPVATAAAYRAFDAAPQAAGDPEQVVAALESHDPVRLAAALDNNMERAARTVVPEVADALAWLRDAPGVIGAAVAGSGSAVFGLCASDVHAADAAGEAAQHGWWSVATRLRASGVEVRGAGA